MVLAAEPMEWLSLSRIMVPILSVSIPVSMATPTEAWATLLLWLLTPFKILQVPITTLATTVC